jgi:hypothetical protein
MDKRNIARIIIAIGCCLLLIGLIGRNCTPRSLQSCVNKIQKELPYSTDDGFALIGFEVSDENLVVLMTYDEHDIRFDDIEVRKELSRFQKGYNEHFANMLTKADDSIWKELIALCKKEEKGMLWLVKGNKSGVTLTMMNLRSNELPEIE